MIWLNRKGFTLVEIMIVVAIIGLLAVIAIPNFIKARETAQKNACINSLRIIDGAIQQWALENDKKSADAVDETAVGGYIKDGWPTCPAGGTYSTTTVGAKPTCNSGVTGHSI